MDRATASPKSNSSNGIDLVRSRLPSWANGCQVGKVGERLETNKT